MPIAASIDVMRYLPFFFACTLFAEVANMSGSWVLNEARSRFNGNTKPGSVTLNVQHNEPKFKYDGSQTTPSDNFPIDFHFDGAIDGKEYAVHETGSDRKVMFRRVSDRVIESDSKGVDTEVHSRITLSGDGRTLERRMTVRGKDQKTKSWVEIYEKK